MRTLIPTVVIVSLVLVTFHRSAQSDPGGLAARVAELEAQVATLEVQGAVIEAQMEKLTTALEHAQEILQYVRVETEPIEGLAGPHVIIEGANVHVRSGSGRTDDGCVRDEPGFPNCESLTGLGNLIVGYNELVRAADRTGSHNLVVGASHSYSSFGGFVTGRNNAVTGPNASVSGGQGNVASGSVSSVSGGGGNTASGSLSSVSGGGFNEATAFDSSISGGSRNVASGRNSSVSGGFDRTAPNDFNWAAGSLLEEN